MNGFRYRLVPVIAVLLLGVCVTLLVYIFWPLISLIFESYYFSSFAEPRIVIEGKITATANMREKGQDIFRIVMEVPKGTRGSLSMGDSERSLYHFNTKGHWQGPPIRLNEVYGVSTDDGTTDGLLILRRDYTVFYTNDPPPYQANCTVPLSESMSVIVEVGGENREQALNDLDIPLDVECTEE